MAQRQRLQLEQVAQVLDLCYLVPRQVQDLQLRHQQVLDHLYHVVVQEQALKLRQAVQILDLLKQVVLQVQCLQVFVGLEVLNFRY